MSEQLLQINQIHADIEEKEILHGVSLNINPGETHVLMGPNGAGKSTLGHVLMGNPKYHISSGNIIFKGNDITGESTDKRARDGIFLSFQEPLETFSGELYPQCHPSKNRQTDPRLGIPQRTEKSHGCAAA